MLKYKNIIANEQGKVRRKVDLIRRGTGRGIRRGTGREVKVVMIDMFHLVRNFLVVN